MVNAENGINIPARYLCKGCHFSPGFLNQNGLIQCAALQNDINPVLKKSYKRFENCPHRKISVMVVSIGEECKARLLRLARFARRLRRRIGNDDRAFAELLSRKEARLSKEKRN